MDTISRKQRSALMSKVRSKDTRPELVVRSLVHRMGYRFRLHRKDLPGTPDLAFPSRKKAIFVHGCFWHGHRCKRGTLPSTNVEFWREKIGRNRVRDDKAKRALRRSQWKYLVVWECELRDNHVLKRKLTKFLEFQSDRLCSSQLGGR